MGEQADEQFEEALRTIAMNNGDAYRDNKNAARAIKEAFRDFQRYRREAEWEDFSLCREELIEELARYWAKH